MDRDESREKLGGCDKASIEESGKRAVVEAGKGSVRMAEEKSEAAAGEKEEEKTVGKSRRSFWKSFFFYYGLMLALYLYFMLANLSMAPKFVYTQF